METIMTNIPEISRLVQESGLETNKAEMHLARFAPHMVKVRELYELSNDIANTTDPTSADSAKAREIRLALVKVRTGAEKEKDDAKRTILNEGNLIQSLFNVVKNTCQLREDHLANIEKHEELKRQKAEAELRAARTDELNQYAPVDMAGIDLGKMPEATYLNFLSGAKAMFEERERKALEAAQEAARQAEIGKIRLRNAERLAQRAQALARFHYLPKIEDGIETISDEQFGDLLRHAESEYAKQQKIRELELQRTAELAQYGGAGHSLGNMPDTEYAILLESCRTKHHAIIERQKAEREAAEQARQEAENARKEAERIANEQRMEAERLRAEQSKREAEAEAERKAAEKAAKKAAQAPDREKIIEFHRQLMSIQLPELNSEAGKVFGSTIEAQRAKFAEWIMNGVATL